MDTRGTALTIVRSVMDELLRRSGIGDAIETVDAETMADLERLLVGRTTDILTKAGEAADPPFFRSNYHLPWAGKLGRIARRCHYCGDGTSSSWRFSSHATCCLSPACPANNQNATAIPEIVKETEQEYDRLSRQWCEERGIDRDATVASYEKHLGPQVSLHGRITPERAAKYIVYKQPAGAAADTVWCNPQLTAREKELADGSWPNFCPQCQRVRTVSVCQVCGLVHCSDCIGCSDAREIADRHGITHT